eukprot:Hpha_TRINITY_DN7194_c0_g1::TRINITY_DN7194_c0_g1_i1::g.29857::m.29857/K13348/MPV17; protein Mpv17
MLYIGVLPKAVGWQFAAASGLCGSLMFAGDVTSQFIETTAAQRRYKKAYHRVVSSAGEKQADGVKRKKDRVGLTLLVGAARQGCRERPPPAIAAVSGYWELMPWDKVRTGRCVLIGALWRAPNQVIWYAFVQAHMAGTGLWHSLWVTAVDQLTFTPWMDVSFLAGESLLHHCSCRQVGADLREKFCAVLVTNWEVWPALNIVMYLWVPPSLWIPYNALCNYGWNVYLTWKAAQVHEDADEEEAAEWAKDAPQ